MARQREMPITPRVIGMRTTGLGTCSPLEQESGPELDLSRAADAWDEPGGLPERCRPGIPAIGTAEVNGVEDVEEFDKHTDLPVASPSKSNELRRAYVEDEGVIAPRRIQRDLLPGGGIDVAIVVVAIGIQVCP